MGVIDLVIMFLFRDSEGYMVFLPTAHNAKKKKKESGLVNNNKCLCKASYVLSTALTTQKVLIM